MGFWLGLFALVAYFWVVPFSYLRPLKYIIAWWLVLLLIAFFPYALILRLMGDRIGDEVANLAVGGVGVIAAYLTLAFVVAVVVNFLSWLKRLGSKAEST